VTSSPAKPHGDNSRPRRRMWYNEECPGDGACNTPGRGDLSRRSRVNATPKRKSLSVIGCPLYEVDDEGRVYSHVKGTEHELTRSYIRGYPVVSVGGKCRYVHQLVAVAFLGPRPVGLAVCHNNGVKDDCRLTNLRHDTYKNNMRDAIRHGTIATGSRNGVHTQPERRPFGERNGMNTQPHKRPSGTRHGQSKLTEDDVREARKLAEAGVPVRSLARKYGVDRKTMWDCVRGNTWRSI
jgi:hypothetical protein